MATNDIRAPFNFVPLSEKVYFPDWADRISHDIPFSDGISGCVDIDILAKSPIFVRNGHSADERDSEISNSFSKTSDGRYFIPGTSIKGVIRNILEIMSFSKITLDKDAMFAQREWDNEKLYTIKKNQSGLRCGYLLKQYGADGRETFVLEDHGEPMRIGFDEIDRYLGQDLFKEHFSDKSSYDINSGSREYNNKKYDPKTAAFKYALVGNMPLRRLCFSKSDRTTEHSVRLEVNPSGHIKGDIVLTGQPDKCKWIRPTEMNPRAGKFYEFVFPAEVSRSYPVSAETFRHFEFIYKDSSEWGRCQTLIDNEGLPVFFRADGNAIKDFGLAYLYKLPYDKSPYESLPKKHKQNDSDLAECIFGKTSKDDSLKGRVQFSNAFIKEQGSEPQADELKLCLGSPKASYYPIYIQQEGGDYLTYNNGRISGWKRYHVRKGIWQQSTGNQLMDSTIRPLKEGTVFKCRMTFHNLRPVELGALFSAITFHNTPECYHQIGQAKSFGFGKVQLTVSPEAMESYDAISLMAKFEQALESHGIANWATTEQITELFTLCHEQVDAEDTLYEYMQMSNKREDNEFLQAKKFRNFLHYYTQKSHKKFQPVSLFGQIRKSMEDKEGKILTEAKNFEYSGDFRSAISRYKDAENIGLHSFAENIAECQRNVNIGIVEQLEKDAKELKQKGQLQEALAKYQEATGYGIKSFATDIQGIEERLNAPDESFADHIGVITSLPALTNSLSKWIASHGRISEEEMAQLIEKLQAKFSSLNNHDKKDWSKWGKRWEDMSKKTGNAITKRLFYSLPQ